MKYFDENDNYTVVKYTATGKDLYNDSYGRYFEIDGENAELVYSSNGRFNGYNADNYIFTNLNEQNEFDELLVTDDNEDRTAPPFSADFRELDPKIDFTKEYLHTFYATDDEEYIILLAYVENQGNSSQITFEGEKLDDITLYLIVAADVSDRSIGVSTEKDKNDILGIFSKISMELGINIKKIDLSGDTFNRKSLLKEVKEIENTSQDIILFYYSGHGYNNPDDNSEYPTMSLDGPDYPLAVLYSDLIKKDPSLLVVIGDLCNSVPQTKESVGTIDSTPLKTAYFFDSNKLYKLLIETHGSIISTSSSRGEWSYCASDIDGNLGNGHFTNSFI